MTPYAVVEVLGLAGVLLAGCAKSPQASADAVLRGTVSYRERVALPPDAVVFVKLPDVSRQDMAAPLIAETRVLSEGRRVPLPFELCYDPKKIEANGVYAVRATIESGGKRFTLDGSALSIYSKGMEKPLRFVRKDP